MHSMAKRQALAIEKITKACTQRKGTAGLNVLLSVICMLFVIGILVMCFMLVGSNLKASTTDADAIDVINETMQSLKESTNFFGIIIIIASIVVVILLLVIVIVSLRQSGMMGG